MRYKVRAFINGRCTVPERFVLYGGEDGVQVPFCLFVYIIEGGDRPRMVETTCKDIGEMNRQAAHVMGELITQRPEETPEAIFSAAGIDPKDVGTVFITHFHYDHCSNLELYPNATVVVSEKGLNMAKNPPGQGRTWAPYGFLEELDAIAAEGRLRLAKDEEILPGIRTMWIGGHSWCNTCVLVDTAAGRVALPGDSIMDYRSIEQNIPAGICTSMVDCIDAIAKVRANADIVLPSHDPAVLERWPGGVVG